MISIEREKLLSEIEQKIGYSFRARALLDRALTHRSFANERAAQNCQHNEAMEFLGDSVLGFVVSAWLLERFPTLSEGKLSKMKAHLVSESSLVELAEAIDLGRYILLNRGEEKTGGRRKRALLADAYEALIGVIYVDAGIAVAERFLRRELRGKLGAIDPTAMIGTDYKSALQERLQAAGGPVPEYAVIEALGPDHRRTFRIELRVAGHAVAQGEGHTIKIAQQEAARLALDSTDALLQVVEEHRARKAARNNGNSDSYAAAQWSQAHAEDAEDATADDAGLSLAYDDESPLDIDVDDPLRAIADEIEAASQCEPAGASIESEDKIEMSDKEVPDKEARGIATDA
ncbi:MAG TPA: ribonuclease III [Blastocatellia bacterium]|nr:ribonuclease III [Blastocatellia bacterium]